MRLSSKSFALVLCATACSGSTVSIPTLSHDSGTGAQPGVDASHETDTGVAPSHEAAAPLPDAAPSNGSLFYIRLAAVGTMVGGGGSQETPVDQRVGVLGVTLSTGPNDPSPIVVIDSKTAIDTSYNAGSITTLGSVPTSQIPPATYTEVRVPVASVQFTVAGTYHLSGVAVPGDFTDLIALTSGVTIDGAVRDRGWWSSSFAVGGMTKGQVSGEHSDIAQPGAGSHIALDLSGPVAAYVFPIHLVIPPDVTHDMEVVFTANTYDDFHWTDDNDPGYKSGVFDVSPSGFEPVTQLGGNSFTVSLGPYPGP